MTIILSILISFLFVACSAVLIQRFGSRTALVDIPNERSSHSIPTPRGGELGYV